MSDIITVIVNVLSKLTEEKSNELVAITNFGGNDQSEEELNEGENEQVVDLIEIIKKKYKDCLWNLDEFVFSVELRTV